MFIWNGGSTRFPEELVEKQSSLADDGRRRTAERPDLDVRKLARRRETPSCCSRAKKQTAGAGARLIHLSSSFAFHMSRERPNPPRGTSCSSSSIIWLVGGGGGGGGVTQRLIVGFVFFIYTWLAHSFEEIVELWPHEASLSASYETFKL